LTTLLPNSFSKTVRWYKYTASYALDRQRIPYNSLCEMSGSTERLQLKFAQIYKFRLKSPI